MDGDLQGQAQTRTDFEDFERDFVAREDDYLTVCSMNLAFRREVIPAFYQFPMDDNAWDVGRFDDIWSGVLLKRAADLVGGDVYNGAPLCEHNKAPRSTFDDLANEVAGLELNEHFWERSPPRRSASSRTQRSHAQSASGSRKGTTRSTTTAPSSTSAASTCWTGWTAWTRSPTSASPRRPTTEYEPVAIRVLGRPNSPMSDGFGRTRRRFLAATGTVAASGLAGCSGLLGGNGSSGQPGLADFRGSGPLVSSRPAPGGTSIEDLPDLEGKLNVYLGGGEGGRYENLLELFNRYYDGFEATWSVQPSSQLAKQIEQEHENDTVRADVFWSVDAGSLAYVADAGATTQLSSEALSPVPDAFKTGQWVGVAGRARAIPYNTEQFAASDIPTDVAAFATDDRFSGAMGWAPTYGAFHSFVTAMRLQRGDEATRQWLQNMVDQNVARYDNEFLVSESAANGEIGAGFANHYYAIRVLARRENAPSASRSRRTTRAHSSTSPARPSSAARASRTSRTCSSATCSPRRPRSSSPPAASPTR